MADGAIAPEQRVSYSAIIDEILAESDLNTISAKRIRKGLQERVDHDITDQKQAITDLIMERFDKFQSDGAEPAPSRASPDEPKANGAAKSEEAESPALSDVADPSPPPAKKAKRIHRDEEEDDAAYARRLQAELNSLNARPTRGGGTKRKVAPTKKTSKPKKKSKAKVGSDDDSDVEGGDGQEKERKGGFNKPFGLSEPLSALLNTTALPRPQVVKQIWAYVKENGLQDPNDKRQIRCDDAMRAVFKSDKIHMFTMNKVLSDHLYPLEELAS